jgi:hypothetical protein
VIAIAILAAYSSLDSYSVAQSQVRDPYGADAAVERFRMVAQRLPPGTPLVYISDVSISSAAGTPAFLAVQHALAPSLLVRSGSRLRPDWAIGNFSRPVDYSQAGAPVGFQMVKDFGTGVVLFRRAVK